MIWILVPVKDLRFAKTRLAGVLSPDERRELTLAMLRDVLDALSRLRSDVRCVVIARDDRVRQAAAGKAALLVESPQARGLNVAAATGLALAAEEGATSVLILPADVPLVTPPDINELLLLTISPPAVAICASADGKGTNALIMNPPQLIETSFGHHSFHAHLAAARTAGAHVVTADLPNLALDLDEPADLVRFLDLARGGETLAVLSSWGIKERLAARR